MPKISVITPFFNSEHYVKECANSVLNQTYKDFEWVVIDDGSTDSTFKLLQDLAKKDKRVKLLTQKNSGAGSARNLGLENIKGLYYTFIDSDDIWHPKLLENALKCIESQNFDLISYGFRDVRGDYVLSEKDITEGSKIRDKVEYYSREHTLDNIGKIKWNLWSKLYKTDIFGKLRFPSHMRQAEDVAYMWQVKSLVKSFASIKNTLYFYRDSETSICRRGINESFIEGEYNLAVFLHDFQQSNMLKNEEDKKFIRKWVANKYYKYFIVETESLKDPQTKDFAKKLREKLLQKNIFKFYNLSLRKKIAFLIFRLKSLFKI